MGLEIKDQSALPMLLLVSTDVTGDNVNLYGESDERFVTKGGTQEIVEGVARKLGAGVTYDHRLLSLQKSSSDEFLLDFEAPGGTKRVCADIVCLTLPFSVLREIRIGIPLPKAKRRVIANQAYGANSKLIAGYARVLVRAEVQRHRIFRCRLSKSLRHVSRARTERRRGAHLLLRRRGRRGARSRERRRSPGGEVSIRHRKSVPGGPRAPLRQERDRALVIQSARQRQLLGLSPRGLGFVRGRARENSRTTFFRR